MLFYPQPFRLASISDRLASKLKGMIFPDRSSVRSCRTPTRDESQTGLISAVAGPSSDVAWEADTKAEPQTKPRLHWQDGLEDKPAPTNQQTEHVRVWDDTMTGASNNEPAKHFVRSHNNTPIRKTKAPDDTTEDMRVLLNVGGVRHETHVSTLKNVPDSRLSRLADIHISSGRGKQEYFFDRHPAVFNSIIDFYRTGKQVFVLDIILTWYKTFFF